MSILPISPHMKRGFKRSAFRYYVKAQMLLYGENPKRYTKRINPLSYVLIFVVSAAVTLKVKSYLRNREPAGTMLIDFYEAKPRLMLPEYMDSLKRE